MVVRGLVRRVVRGVVRRVVRGVGSVGSPRSGGQFFQLSLEEVSPSIVYCLLPGREKNSGQQRCDSPRNHSELFDSFTRNFSHGEYGITHEALDEILKEINKTIGNFLTEKKVGEI